jgi:DeoR/GlpR family transcriptional regulator of sugar metabolism
MQEIANMRPDLPVLRACSFHVDHGVGAFNFEDAQMKNVLIQNAGSVALALLNEKLRSVATQIVSSIDSISDVVVEVDAPCLRQTPLCKKDYASIGPTQQSVTAEARTQRWERTLNKEKYERD